MLAECLSMVGCNDDEGVAEASGLLESSEEATEGCIRVVQLAVIKGPNGL